MVSIIFCHHLKTLKLKPIYRGYLGLPVSTQTRSLSSFRSKCLHPINIFTYASTALLFASGFLYKQIQGLGRLLDNLVPDIIKTNQSSYVIAPEKEIEIDYEEPQFLSLRKKDWNSWRHFHGKNFWLLAKLTHSEHQKTRCFIIEALSKIKNWPWSDAEYRMIAQVIDARTIIGLAHSNHPDLRFFLRPPAIPHSDTTTEEDFRNLLSNLPTESLDSCAKYFMKRALPKDISPSTETVWTHSEFGAELLEPHPVERSLVQRYLLYLQALLSHSRIAAHCHAIVDQKGLVTLRRLYHESDNIHIIHLIGKILGNLSEHENLHSDVFNAGWVTIFAEWMQGKDFYLQLLALKCLINMDKDYESLRGVFQDGVYQYYPQYRSRCKTHADVIFVAGLLGGPAWTWRQTETEEDEERTRCWPLDWLARDCPNIRILTLEYDTSLSEWSPLCPYGNESRTIKSRSAAFLKKLRAAGVGDRPIIWVGHSMGGLLIKSILAMDTATDLADKTQGVLFFSVPHRGSAVASWAADSKRKYLLFPSPEVQELVSDSKELIDLHERFKGLLENKHISVLSFGEGLPMKLALRSNGKELLRKFIVPPESSDPGFGEFKLMSSLNHLTICKPSSKHSSLYQDILTFIRNCGPVSGRSLW